MTVVGQAGPPITPVKWLIAKRQVFLSEYLEVCDGTWCSSPGSNRGRVYLILGREGGSRDKTQRKGKREVNSEIQKSAVLYTIIWGVCQHIPFASPYLLASFSFKLNAQMRGFLYKTTSESLPVFQFRTISTNKATQECTSSSGNWHTNWK